MKSQKVKEEHQERVRNDIAVAICHTTVIQNLLKGSLQILNLKLADVRILMDRIVHSSIMTVNAFSMEKLFELTLIATKYQYTTCQYPSDILLIALNHLDTIRKTVTDTTAKTLAENLHNVVVDRFKDVNVLTMQTYRYLVLSYLADVKLKMTNLIRLGLQKSSGEFVKQFPDKVKRAELARPGLIEVYQCPDEDETNDSKLESEKLDDEETLLWLTSGKCPTQVKVPEVGSMNGAEILTTRFKVEDPEVNNFPTIKPSLALNGDRGIALGLSIYDIPGNCDEAPIKAEEDETEKKGEVEDDELGDKNHNENASSKQDYFANSDLYATRGLDLCSVMLGCGDNSSIISSSGRTPGTSSQTISASALGLESVLENFPSFGLGSNPSASSGQSEMRGVHINPSSVNVINFDARSDSTGSKAALVAIAQDFFELDVEEAEGGDGNKYKTAIDDLLGNFDMPEEDG